MCCYCCCWTSGLWIWRLFPHEVVVFQPFLGTPGTYDIVDKQVNIDPPLLLTDHYPHLPSQYPTLYPTTCLLTYPPSPHPLSTFSDGQGPLGQLKFFIVPLLCFPLFRWQGMAQGTGRTCVCQDHEQIMIYLPPPAPHHIPKIMSPSTFSFCTIAARVLPTPGKLVIGLGVYSYPILFCLWYWSHSVHHISWPLYIWCYVKAYWPVKLRGG